MPTAKLPESLSGFCDERFAPVAALLDSQLANGDHHGVAFAARYHGQPVVDLWGGSRSTPEGDAPWQDDTMVLTFSTTKGITATALHMAMERTKTSYDSPVAEVWPEFGDNGKEKITIRQLLCHEAGVPQIRDEVPDVWALPDYERMVGIMEGLEPLWEPGTANGYHAINFGWLIGETLRRVDGRHIQTFLADELAGPLSLDGLFIGAPTSEHPRIAPLLSPQSQSVFGDDQYDNLLPKETVLYKALSARGSLVDLFNSSEGMSSCIPSISGAFTARSIATVYSALDQGGEVDGVRLLSLEHVKTVSTIQNDRQDLVISRPCNWRLGYMGGGDGAIRSLGPNADAYGHVGAGGTIGGVDPKAHVSFGLIYDKWGPTEFLGGPRTTDVVDAVVRSAEAAS